MTLREIFTTLSDFFIEWLGRLFGPISGILDLKIGEDLFHIDFIDRLIFYAFFGIVVTTVTFILIFLSERKVQTIKDLYVFVLTMQTIIPGIFIEVIYWIVFLFFWIATQLIAQ